MLGIFLSVLLTGGVAGADLVDNENGTITDTATGLMWQKATAVGTFTWQEALAYAEELVLPSGGYSDWRLPNRNELQTLVDYTRYDPAIDPSLQTSTASSPYWSSTTNVNVLAYAWRVDFYNGLVDTVNKTRSHYVRAVRWVFITGDINADGLVDLADAVLALRVAVGMDDSMQTICQDADANGDGIIGLAEALYVLQHAAGVR